VSRNVTGDGEGEGDGDGDGEGDGLGEGDGDGLGDGDALGDGVGVFGGAVTVMAREQVAVSLPLVTRTVALNTPGET
jgi:hypothetical protein